jgi:hypothetical protein
LIGRWMMHRGGWRRDARGVAGEWENAMEDAARAGGSAARCGSGICAVRCGAIGAGDGGAVCAGAVWWYRAGVAAVGGGGDGVVATD